MITIDELTEQEEARRGALLAEVLSLKKSKADKDRWFTQWGTKTDLGLFRVIKRLMLDGE